MVRWCFAWIPISPAGRFLMSIAASKSAPVSLHERSTRREHKRRSAARWPDRGDRRSHSSRERQGEMCKVPLLGDIPVAGWLFSNYRNSLPQTRTLVLSHASHRVLNSADAERIKALEAARMNWCLSNQELADLGLPPEEPSTPATKKKTHFWHRKKAKPEVIPGAAEGLLLTTVTHEPPQTTFKAAPLDKSLWPNEKRPTVTSERTSVLTPTKAELHVRHVQGQSQRQSPAPSTESGRHVNSTTHQVQDVAEKPTEMEPLASPRCVGRTSPQRSHHWHCPANMSTPPTNEGKTPDKFTPPAFESVGTKESAKSSSTSPLSRDKLPPRSLPPRSVNKSPTPVDQP